MKNERDKEEYETFAGLFLVFHFTEKTKKLNSSQSVFF